MFGIDDPVGSKRLGGMNPLIIAHQDADGVCSASIVVHKHEGAGEIVFTSPHLLGRVLKKINIVKNIYVLDVALNKGDASVLRGLIELRRQGSEVIVIDHHISTMRVQQLLTVHGVNVMVSTERASAAEFCLELLYGAHAPQHLREVALMASSMEKGRYDILPERLRSELCLLSSAVNYGRIRREILGVVTKGLAEGRMPSEIEEVRKAHEEIREVMRRFQKPAMKFLRRISDDLYLWDLRRMFLGCVIARCLIRCVIKRVEGVIVCLLPKGNNSKNIAVMIRKHESIRVDLLKLCHNAIMKCGGRINGHKEAVGGIIPVKKLNMFLKMLASGLKEGVCS